MNLATLYRTQGLAAVQAELAAQYPDVLAQLNSLGAAAPPPLLARAIVGAVCADDQDNAIAIAQRLFPSVPPLLPLRLAPMAALADYCRARGLRHKVVLAPQLVKITPPSPYTMPFTYMTEAAIIASLPRAQYIPGWDVVIGEDNTLLRDSGYLPPDVATHAFLTFYINKLDCMIHYAPAEEVFVDEDVLFLSTPDNNVGHWMIDFLPRLKGLDYVPGGKAKVVVPLGMHGRYMEMLKAFGFGESDMVICDPRKRYRFRMCHFYRPGQATPPNPTHVQFVRDGFVGDRHLKIQPGKRVFLARTQVGTRLVANHEEFAAFLEAENIVSAELADLTLEQQHELLNDAEIILGTFGSNLFGMYLAPPGCTILALMNDLTEDVCVAPTAHMLGMQHEIFLCDRAPEAGVKRYKRDTNVTIDCAALRERLAEIPGRYRVAT